MKKIVLPILILILFGIIYGRVSSSPFPSDDYDTLLLGTENDSNDFNVLFVDPSPGTLLIPSPSAYPVYAKDAAPSAQDVHTLPDLSYQPQTPMQTPIPVSIGETDSLSAYAPVIDTYRSFLSSPEAPYADSTARGDYYLVYGETGVSILCRYGGIFGYALLDLNGDSIPELLVGVQDSQCYDDFLLDLFTLKNGLPERILVSSERINYRLQSSGLIYYHASGGASYNREYLYRFNGVGLELVDGLVMDDTLIYRTTIERQDVSSMLSSDVSISIEQYSALCEEWSLNSIEFSLTSF